MRTVRLPPLPPATHSQRPEQPDQRVTPLQLVFHRLVGTWCNTFPRKASLQSMVAEIERQATSFENLPQKQLRDKTAEIRHSLVFHGFTRESVISCFALIRETSRRTLGLYPYPCQLFGGLVMLHGMVAEMDTGEGKTLTATLPAATAALAGIPVHVVTVNDYLTSRDAELMGPLYRELGLSVGCVVHQLNPEDKREAYLTDITYVTNKELAFDYLRDRLTMAKRTSTRLLQAEQLHSHSQKSRRLLLRGLCFAIVDEADSILIDEARTPLIISGQQGEDEQQEFLQQALDLAERLEADVHFRLDRQRQSLQLLEKGRQEVEDEARHLGPLWEGLVRRESTVHKALQALHLFRKDENYLVRDGKVLIIDEFTGRVMEGRSWEQGLHQLVELKEGCELSSRRETLAKISFQRFFRRYLHLAGMTGTAKEVRGELYTVYRMPTMKIPPNRPCRRTQHPDQMFLKQSEKWQAVVSAITAMHSQGRPVLVGTRSVKDSEHLAALLQVSGLPHRVLNAKQDAREAEIVALAGQHGAITIATNMAGRGTDIKLGAGVAGLGGLHVLATERHEASRIDRQLAGRAGRQGDPGSYQALLSFEDTLFASATGKKMALLARFFGHFPRRISVRAAQLLVRRAQIAIERYHKRTRRQLFRQDQAQSNLLSFSGKLE